jgi:HAD superfamily hydrolase (TIGR01549 family)
VFLIFDAYGTLAELDNFYDRLQQGFLAHGLDLPLDAIVHAAHIEMRHYMKNSLRASQDDAYDALRNECAAVLMDDLRAQGHKIPLSAEESVEVLRDAIVFHLFPETLRTLESLRGWGIKMGVASNWDGQLPMILGDLGLAPYFEFILSSAHIGFEKPAPEFFAHAHTEVERCMGGQFPDRARCFYIGDHWEKDVVPARAAGFTPLWLERQNRDIASGEVPEAIDGIIRLRTLEDILPLV